MLNKKKKQKLDAPVRRGALRLAAVGMESEFAVVVDGRPTRPESLFHSPRDFIREPLVHRIGTSYHLPTGGAVYFDTGVIEVATPVIEIERGCAARAGRSLWEAILFVRRELDAWEARAARSLRLVGFSTHYNVSFDVPLRPGPRRRIEELALLAAYVVPVPVMLLAANRRSTGVGVRPRGDRIEVTVDFTPVPELMIATGTFLVAALRGLMTWPSWGLDSLDRQRFPVIRGFRPVPHTTRHGWLANVGSFPRNPFTADIDHDLWETTGGEWLSLREIGGRIARSFRPELRAFADSLTLGLVQSIVGGRGPSLLALEDRPPAYEDVGRACRWENLFPERVLPRSRYERVLLRAVSGRPLRMFGRWYTPVGMRGWAQVVFRRPDGRRSTFPIDYLVDRLEAWERPTSSR